MLTKNITLSFVIGTCLMHLFCCGIPLLISLTSLTTVIGVAGSDFFEVSWFEAVEDELMIFSGILLLVSGLIQYISKRIDCRKDGHCQHAPCDSKKDLSHHVFLGAAILYAINITIFLMS